MMIVDVIQEADSEYVVFFLLAAYIEAAQFAAKLPEHVRTLPIAGFGDVELRYQQLMMALHSAVEQPHGNACPEIEDALRVFDTALCRLAFLEGVGKSSKPFTVSGSPGRYEPQVAGSSPAAR